MCFCYSLIFIKLFYMFLAMDVHQEEVSFRKQSLCYNVTTKYIRNE